MNQPRIKLLALLIVLIAALGLSAWAVANYLADRTDSQTQATEEQAIEAVKVGRTKISYQAQPGITSLAQLEKEASNIVIEESGYGKIVTSIEGHESGTDGKYWSFYVNGEMAQVGADAYTQKEGDFIEWKFQKL